MSPPSTIQVLRQRFGQADAIEYLRELNGHRELLKKLTRLHTEVEKAHAVRKAEAAGCGMNVQRAQRLQAIEDACAREDGGVKSFSGKRSLTSRAPTEASEPPADSPAAPADAPSPVDDPSRGEDASRGEQMVSGDLGGEAFTEALERTAALPVGSFRRHC